jgi:protein-S-isoprenylcysteine O-methyltransferase Ste14
MLLSALGCGIMGWNIFFLLCTLCFACAYTIRSVGEDMVLKRRFGKKYEQYAAKTGAVFPRFRK